MLKAAVIAGTPVDTKMGVDYCLKKAGIAGLAGVKDPQYVWGEPAYDEKELPEVVCPEVMPYYYPVSGSCEEQLLFQYSTKEEKTAEMDKIFDDAVSKGISHFFIYCNSLSGAFNFDEYAPIKGVQAFTPLQVYRVTGKNYNRPAVLAANNLSTHNIEECLMEGSLQDAGKEIYVVGSGNMQLVHSIEEYLPPKEILDRCGMDGFVHYAESCGCDCLILGCTHFPYFKEELKEMTRLPIIDPADEMYENMLS